ncbi:MAG TPA: formate dehydrogenase subunit delta [Aliidongia sp.]|uniref:formate dehydrogenase subunit delta n=1 Tax=Aliidongia sp. TaxID=1914230 RepID=UPI002DDCDA17|nr:formate dehydrogenase subunit delta [Aliidongia sp.]HEV2674850.1 formate dehydrogenase subunit delta [Aliidongia sp.]
MHADRLIRMANQIATYFSSYPHDEAVAGITDHLKQFWEPRMLVTIKQHVADGGTGLHGLVPEAVRRLS